LDGFIWVLLKGFFTGGSLIVAIGAQNAFVLSQGVQRRYPGVIAFTCTALDTTLITLGVLGMGALIQARPDWLFWITLFGALFLTGYALRAFWRAFQLDTIANDARRIGSASKAVMVTLALSLLNPHVYLDTVVLLGAIGGVYENQYKLAFIAGAAFASLTWFYSLSYGARLLAPMLNNAHAWRVLDFIIGAIMSLVAASLWRSL
jgi:L-lysine exporter family protein LysE/ArgO